jgi:carbamate kinase
MGPKVRAAAKFVTDSGKQAVITSIDTIVAGVKGEAGTRIADS